MNKNIFAIFALEILTCNNTNFLKAQCCLTFQDWVEFEGSQRLVL